MNMPNILPQSEEEWKKKLTPDEYLILREKGTEAPFSGSNLYEKRNGFYICAACGNLLFSSDTKFDSGSGWPSFDEALPGAIHYSEDMSQGMKRIEITCAKCSSHLGHLFNDGPTNTKKRYCTNSICLKFKNKNKGI